MNFTCSTHNTYTTHSVPAKRGEYTNFVFFFVERELISPFPSALEIPSNILYLYYTIFPKCLIRGIMLIEAKSNPKSYMVQMQV